MHAVASTSPPAASADDLLRDYSIEITSKDVADLPKAAALLTPGTRTSVTFLPNESAEQRLAAVRAVIAAGLRPVPHISARRIASQRDLEAYLDALAGLGAASDLFIVAGDPDTPMGPYQDALAVIRSGLLDRYGVEHVGIGGYPEGHPKIPDQALWTALRDKAVAVRGMGMALSIVTQFGFDAGPVVHWTRRVRDEGLEAPIRIGIPGPANAGTLIRFAARCGVSASTSVLRKYGLSVTRLMQSAGPDAYVEALTQQFGRAPAGQVGLHFYPFGGLEKTARWIDAAGQRAR